MERRCSAGHKSCHLRRVRLKSAFGRSPTARCSKSSITQRKTCQPGRLDEPMPLERWVANSEMLEATGAEPARLRQPLEVVGVGHLVGRRRGAAVGSRCDGLSCIATTTSVRGATTSAPVASTGAALRAATPGSLIARLLRPRAPARVAAHSPPCAVISSAPAPAAGKSRRRTVAADPGGAPAITLIRIVPRDKQVVIEPIRNAPSSY